MKGYKCNISKRIFGYKRQNSCNEEFFIECRNFTKSWSGIMGALITKRCGLDIYDACLIFTQGIIYDTKTNEYKVCLHRLKPGIGYKSLLKNYSDDEFIRSSFYKNLIK